MVLPTHHVPEEELVAFAAGTSPVGTELLVACHLTVCPSCRLQVSLAEAIGGALFLSTSPVADVGPLQGQPETPAVAPPRDLGPTQTDPMLPRPLQQRLLNGLRGAPWRSVGFGVRSAVLRLGTEQRTFLLDFPSGFALPQHDHTGLERALVLRGGFQDAYGHYVRGDVSWRGGEQDDHVAVVDDDGRCTTLFVTDGPAVLPAGPVATMLVDWWLS